MEKQNKQLTLGSLFDGSGGFPLGGMLCGIKPIWASEIEPFAVRVATKRLPDMVHYGDVSTLNGAELPPVDIITWGSPCQDLSVAGKRAGLDGERSGLYREAVRIVGEMLDATDREFPKFCVFENVPGLLSSNKGNDFTACLDMMQSLGFLPDPNILDAQDMGVPQRRKRVYITWVNVDYILSKKTNLSRSITLQLHTEILQTILAGLSRASGGEPKKSAVSDARFSEDGLRKRIDLFSIQKESRLLMLQGSLDETQAMYGTGRKSSGGNHGGDRTEGSMLTTTDTKSTISIKGSLSGYTGWSLKQELDEALNLLKSSTTLTLTKETIDQKICFYAKTLLNTLDATIRWMQSQKDSGAMGVQCCEWVLHTLTWMEEFINAKRKYDKSTKGMEWDDCLRFIKSGISSCEKHLVADFAGGSAGKVLFESEGVSGYSAEGFRAWQRAAGGAAEGIGAAGGICLNDQGGQRMDVTDDVTCTLRAEAHHPPCIMEAAGFCTEHSADSRGIGYGEELSPTLRAGTVPAAVALENHPTDSRVKVSEENMVQTLTSRMGTGGGNVPLVMDAGTPKTLKIRAGGGNGGKGALIQNDKSATLSCNNDQTLFVPFCKGTRPHSAEEAPTWKDGEVANTLNTFDIGENRCNELVVQAFGICSKDSNAMKSDNPHSGFYEADTSRTLDANGGNPSCNQGGIAVVAVQGSMIGREDKNGPQGSGVNEDVSFTLNATDHHAVAYPTFCASKASFFTRAEEEVANTLVATDYKDPPVINDVQTASGKDVFGTISASMGSKQWLGNQEAFSGDYHIVEPDYIVRRLTPTECARLQGFPDWWCSGLGTDDPTEEEMIFWREVFETHRRITGTSGKPKSDSQIRKWLKDPHSDSAEYKMWGNGCALPNVYFVLSGIVYYAQFPDYLL